MVLPPMCQACSNVRCKVSRLDVKVVIQIIIKLILHQVSAGRRGKRESGKDRETDDQDCSCSAAEQLHYGPWGDTHNYQGIGFNYSHPRLRFNAPLRPNMFTCSKRPFLSGLEDESGGEENLKNIIWSHQRAKQPSGADPLHTFVVQLLCMVLFHTSTSLGYSTRFFCEIAHHEGPQTFFTRPRMGQNGQKISVWLP